MQPASPAALQLAQRLRQLRLQWSDARLTQEKLAGAFSIEERLAAATVSSWESLSSPKLPPPHRLRAYARFFATRRSVEAGFKLLTLAEFTQEEEAAYKNLETELLGLRSLVVGDSAEDEIAFSRSWHFAETSGPVIIICAELPDDQKGPLAEPSNPNFTALQAVADSDSLMELHGHIRAENPPMTVHFKIPSEVDTDDLTGHLILVGGVVWNAITERVYKLARLPVRQVVDPKLRSGDPFVANVDGKDREFWPKWADHEGEILAEDVGLLARVPNPLNPSRTLTICNGIHSRGVYGAVRSLTDAKFRDANERYISTNFGNSESFAILMSIQIIENKAMTPAFGAEGIVLYQWRRDIAA